MKDFGGALTGFITAIIGVAIVAVVLSQGATSVSVLGTFFSGLSQLLSIVISPVTGGANYAGGGSAYAGEVNLGTNAGTYGGGASGQLNGLGSISASNGGFGIGINGLGSLAVSGSSLVSLAGSAKSLFGSSGISSSSGSDSEPLG